MSNRIAHVCAALKTPKFLEPNGLRLVETSGPPSGTSTTVVYTYELLDTAVHSAAQRGPFGRNGKGIPDKADLLGHRGHARLEFRVVTLEHGREEQLWTRRWQVQ